MRYALLRRADTGSWQAVAGGAERGESLQEAARREAFEEAGIPPDRHLTVLASTATIPVVEVACFPEWPDLLVVPEYAFGIEAPPVLTLSAEHGEWAWFDYHAAVSALVWDSNRNALWELNQVVCRRHGSSDQPVVGDQDEPPKAASSRLLIRDGRPGDLSAILALLDEDALRRSPPEWSDLPRATAALAEIVGADHSTVLVGELDGEVVATAQVTWQRRLALGAALVCQLESVRVSSSRRGHGLGAELVGWVIADARRRGCARVELTSDNARVDAHRFYERLGFEATHRGMKLYLVDPRSPPRPGEIRPP